MGNHAEGIEKRNWRFNSWTVGWMIWLGALWQMIQIRKFKGAALNVKEFTLHSFISHSQEQHHSSEKSQRQTIGSSHRRVLKWFLFFSSLGRSVSKDVSKIITKEHFSSYSRSQLITVRWKVIRLSSQRRAHQTSSLQALSGFISISSPLSQAVMTLSRRDCSPLRDGKRWLWNIEPRNIIWLTMSWSPAKLFCLTVMTVWTWLNCHNDRAGSQKLGVEKWNFTSCYLWQHVGGVALCPSLLLYLNERASVTELEKRQNFSAGLASSKHTGFKLQQRVTVWTVWTFAQFEIHT